MEAEREAFSIAEFCERYSVGQSLVFKHMREGLLPFRKAGRRTLIGRADADRWLNSLPQSRQSSKRKEGRNIPEKCSSPDGR